MAHADYKVIINKPAQAVFDFLADGLNNIKWRSSVIDIGLKSGTNGAQGAEYAQTLKGPGGSKVAGDYKLTEVKPYSGLVFLVTTGPARPSGRYTLTKTSPAATTVFFSLDYKTTGLKKLIDPMITKTMKSEVANLDVLKKVLEESSYKCPECGLHYEHEEVAKQCEEFCKTNHACNLEITRQSAEVQFIKQA